VLSGARGLADEQLMRQDDLLADDLPGVLEAL
jgi:hypothetical protein